MTDSEALYRELKPEIGEVASELFHLSKTFLAEQGNFLPHAVVLTSTGDLRLVGADPGNSDGTACSTEVLPLLHYGLRQQASPEVVAVGVAENVTVTLDGQSPTSAIEVLFEHCRGLTVALYLPFDSHPDGTFVFGTVFSKVADPEVVPWARSVA